MKILPDVYEQIIQCPSVPPEKGGILGIKNGVVCYCFYDNSPPQSNSAVYIPNVDFLNAKIRKWEERGIGFGGMFHSHAVNQPTLSADDIEYIKAIFQAMPKSIKSLFFPVVLPNVELVSFIAIRQKDTIRIFEDKITIIQRSIKNEHKEERK